MGSSNFKVIVVGLGIAGTVAAILLERAGIEYIVLERMPRFRSSPSAIALNAQTLRLFEQLGLLDQILAIAVPIRRIAFYRQNLQPLTAISLESVEDKHGYASILVSRADLLTILLEAIPPERILWNRRVLEVTEYRDCVSVRTQDGVDHDGHILIGVDGAYSAVRHHMFKILRKKGQVVPETDLQNFRFEMFGSVGTAKQLDRWKYQALRASTVDMMAIVSDDIPYTLWLLPLKGERITWFFGAKRKEPKSMRDDHTFRLSEWDLRADESQYQQAREMKLPIAGTLGDLIDSSGPDEIVQVMVDEKCFKTWYSDRIVLAGDACHKLVVFGGQGATQAILDAVCLINLLQEMPKDSASETRQVFATYYEQRFPIVQNAFQSSGMLASLATKTGKVANVTRRIATKLIPQAMMSYSLDKMLVHRPIANFLPPPPSRGRVPPRSQSVPIVQQQKHQSSASSWHSWSRSSQSAKSTISLRTASSSATSSEVHSVRPLPSTWSQIDLEDATVPQGDDEYYHYNTAA